MVEQRPTFHAPAEARLDAEVRVDDRRVDPRTVAFEQFGFGKEADPPLPLHSFVLVAAPEAFLDRFRPLFERAMAELRDDDARYGYDSALDSPRPTSLEELFGLSRDDRMRVMSFFWPEILSMYVDAPDERLCWVGMSVEDIALADGHLRIAGTVRRPVRRAGRGLTGAVRRLLARLRP
ncbi:MAG: hypothetical protein HYU62_02450 [Caulobacterales bacterium]|nr:hypothetical protein [Caulobacterales bacterium]